METANVINIGGASLAATMDNGKVLTAKYDGSPIKAHTFEGKNGDSAGKTFRIAKIPLTIEVEGTKRKIIADGNGELCEANALTKGTDVTIIVEHQKNENTDKTYPKFVVAS